MLNSRSARNTRRRRGMILLVVLALLTLFAIVGISFVYVAGAQETEARIAREAEVIAFKPRIDPQIAFSYVMGQLLYDVNDYEVTDISTGQPAPNDFHRIAPGVYSGLRGHSLARNMYGWYDATLNDTSDARAVPGSGDPVLNDRAFSGVGRVNFTHTGPGNFGVEDLRLMNYMYFNEFKLRDPERLPSKDSAGNYQYRASPTDRFNVSTQPYFPMGGVPYTYPDHNNYFLAHIDAVTGQVLTPSFHREYLFGRLDLTATPPANPDPFVNFNPNWSQDPKGKYYTLRPTPGYHPAFPMPVDRHGDVKNLDGAPGGSDSVWIDIGAPVITTPDGRKFKMLVAPLILDLDGRLDLNVIGNLMGNWGVGQQAHRSNQGWGAWEINPQRVLNADGTEWRNLFYGSREDNRYSIAGRYNTDNDPAATGSGPWKKRPAPYDTNADEIRWRMPLGPQLTGGEKVRGWSQVDYNGAKEDNNKSASDKYALPKAPGASAYFGFPDFDTSNSFGNGGVENRDHARLYWPYRPRAASPPAAPAYQDRGSNRRFPLRDMVPFLRHKPDSGDSLGSDLSILLSQNLTDEPPVDQAAKDRNFNRIRRRNLITLLSADLDRPGATPYVWNPLGNTAAGNNQPDSRDTRYGLKDPATMQIRFSLAGNKPIPFPDPFAFRLKVRAPAVAVPFDKEPDAPAGGDFDPTTWRNSLSALTLRNAPPSVTLTNAPPVRHLPRQRLSLLRDLKAYPVPAAGTDVLDLSVTATRDQFDQATNDRQRFAEDLFNVLRHATGAGGDADINTHAKAVWDTFGGRDSAEFRALRSLAQIAVNIVDYLDSDDVMTSFRWADFTPTAGGSTRQIQNVHGFELPRLVINETYVQYDNKAGTITADRVDAVSGKYNVNVWAELMNPLPNDSALSGSTDTEAKLEATIGGAQKPIYRILLAEGDLNTVTNSTTYGALRDPSNVTGAPRWPTTAADPVKKTMDKWGAAADPKKVLPAASTARFEDATKTNKGFYVVAPDTTYEPKTGFGVDPQLPMTIKSTEMTYEVDVNATTRTTKPKPTLLLQRLSNPSLPSQPNDTLPDYNPWITIDFVEHSDAMVMEGRHWDDQGLRDGAGSNPSPPDAMSMRTTIIRHQPFGADLKQRKDVGALPEVVVAPAMQSPKHTFFRQNSLKATQATLDLANNGMAMGDETLLKLPFDWMVHLDRRPNSPMELLHVSGVSPHLVTQDNIQAAGVTAPAHKHVVPWDTADARLYRFFEFVSVPPVGTGPMPVQMDRVMGRVNINSLWNRDVFRAICDAANPNVFSEAEVDALFDSLVKSRTAKAKEDAGAPGDFYIADYNPTLPVTPTNERIKDGLRPTDANLYKAMDPALRAAMGNWPATPTDADLDRPFWSLGLGHKPDTLNFAGRATGTEAGLGDTILRGNRFDLSTPTHPYQKKELLRKVFNNLTTRSNVYAVWLTVGFFEVTDAAATPPKLGAEIGKAENKQVRYRMFAIVDRTNFKAFETTCHVFDTASVIKPPPATNVWKPGDPVQIRLNDPTILSVPPTEKAEASDKITIRDLRTNRDWNVTVGTVLTFEPNTDNEESVTVFKYTPPMGASFLAARFQRTHPAGCRVICRGNPGPMTRYDPRADAEAVPFFTMID